jgi:hypothetical protein
MSSTRNKNSIGNYELEQFSIYKSHIHTTFVNGPFGKAIQTHFPGDGLLPGRVSHAELNHNACDIESFLYGIGTTNLVKPFVEPSYQPKNIQSLNIIDKIPLIIPKPLIIEGNQRPLRL